MIPTVKVQPDYNERVALEQFAAEHQLRPADYMLKLLREEIARRKRRDGTRRILRTQVSRKR